MNLTRRVLERFASNELEQALDLLADLKELDANLAKVVDTFHLHYASTINPEVQSQIEALIKAREGLKKAKDAQRALSEIAALYTDDKTAARALVEANRMVDKFERHVESTRNMVRKLSKKETPPALKTLAKQVENALSARLIDPSQLEVFAWQRGDHNYLSNVSGVEHQVRLRATLEIDSDPDYESMAGKRKRAVDLILLESTVSDNPGVRMAIAWDGENPRQSEEATKDKAVAKFLDAVRGWSNVKGETESQAQRKPVAQSIANALNSLIKRLGSDHREAKVSSDFRTISADYRDWSLPKEGESSVGEYAYGEMVKKAVAEFRARIETALRPYQSSIQKIEIHDGEKSWLYASVHLK